MASLRCCRLVAALSLGLAVSPASGEAVDNLSAASFNKRIQEDILLVKFYAPWCGHCKAMAPAYEEAAQQLAKHSPPVPLGKVDATVEPQITQDQGIRGYPTLKIYRKGVASDYGGPRDAAGIVKFMLEQIGASAPAGAASASETDSPPMLMASLCRDQTCDDDKFPILDYDEVENKCMCSAHPCWDDDGKAHDCATPEFPHIGYSYTKDGKLECSCRTTPQYISPYIGKVKCPGEHCDSLDFPLVDFDPKEKKCVCRKHPCEDLDGVKHDCNDPAFPILLYREEQTAGGVKKICECKAPFKMKKDEL